MPKIARKLQKIFGLNKTGTEVAQFGSTQAGTQVFSDDPDILQSGTAYENGWSDGTIGGDRLPPLEEINALTYLNNYQIAYMLQEGVPEYNSSTTYYLNSIVKESGTTKLYKSLTDDNTGNPLTDAANWLFKGSAGGSREHLKTVIADGTSDNIIFDNLVSTFSKYEVEISGGLLGDYDITSASYSGNSFSVVSEEGLPLAIAFNPDGTKMFIVGANNNTVFEYNLTTGYDITSASYSGNSFSVSTEDTGTGGIAFNPDGTKMFMIGGINDAVFEYNLTTGYDITSASYSGNSFSVVTEDTGTTAIAFNPNGTKMFIVGSNNDAVFEYNIQSTQLSLVISQDNGSSFETGVTDYNYYFDGKTSASTSLEDAQASNDSIILSGNTLGITDSYTAKITLSNLGSVNLKNIIADGGYITNESGVSSVKFSVSGTYKTNNLAIDAIKLENSNDVIVSGSFSLYGIY